MAAADGTVHRVSAGATQTATAAAGQTNNDVDFGFGKGTYAGWPEVLIFYRDSASPIRGMMTFRPTPEQPALSFSVPCTIARRPPFAFQVPPLGSFCQIPAAGNEQITVPVEVTWRVSPGAIRGTDLKVVYCPPPVRI